MGELEEFFNMPPVPIRPKEPLATVALLQHIPYFLIRKTFILIVSFLHHAGG